MKLENMICELVEFYIATLGKTKLIKKQKKKLENIKIKQEHRRQKSKEE